MRRCEFIGLIGGAAIWPVIARAQQPGGRMARMAYLGPSSPAIVDPRQIEQFEVGLVENDLIVGKNVTVEYFWAEGSLDRLKSLATELAGRDFDVNRDRGTAVVSVSEGFTDKIAHRLGRDRRHCRVSSTAWRNRAAM